MRSAKKLLCLLLAAVLLLALGAPALAVGDVPVDAAQFPDETFRAFVAKECDTDGDGKLSAAEIAAVQSLDLPQRGIADLTGVQVFTALDELLCYENPLTSLDVSGMTKLKTLDCSGCGSLTALNAAGCTALTALDCPSCALSALNLTGCTALQELECSYNELAALDLSDCAKLIYCACSGNRLTALDLGGHSALRILICSENALSALDLTGCTALTDLDCSNNCLAALDLSGCTALQTSTVGSSDKAENPALSTQYLPEQAVMRTDSGCTVDFTAIVGADNLGRVKLVTGAKSYSATTGLAEFDRVPDYFSYEYDTGRSGIPTMRVAFESEDVSFAVALDAAHFPDAAFRDFLSEACDRNGNGALSALELLRTDTLDCSGLGIADLTGIGHFTALTALNCENNRLTALDLSANTNLALLRCDGNALKTLDLTANRQLSLAADTGFEQHPDETCVLAHGANGTGTLDLTALVGRDNLKNVLAVEGAAYDPDTGVATFTAPCSEVRYTYDTGSKAVTLTVRLNADSSAVRASVYTDVPGGQWYFDAVHYAYDHALMEGMGEGEFAPGLPMTRAMLVTVLYRMAGEPAVTGGHPFTDVPDGQWYSDAVAWAYQQGIVNGMTATTFCPTLDITREQTATILMRDTAKSGGDVSARAPLSAFPDAESVSGYALEAMQWAVAAKVINGVTSDGVNYLRPGENATRAQIATLLQNYLENVA